MPQELVIGLVQGNQLILPAAPVEGDDLIPGFGAPGIEGLSALPCVLLMC